MIISHKYKFVFVKVPKTGSTSVEYALSSICGPDDVVTPIDPKEISPWTHEARNYLTIENHMPIQKAWELAPESKEYFSFCVERNPWDKVISARYWRLRKGDKIDLKFNEHELLELVHVKSDSTSWQRYAEGDNILVDKVIMYHRLQEGLDEVCDHLNMPRLELPRLKGGFRPDVPCSDFHNDASREMVSHVFRREIKAFGFKFPGEE